jgi:chromosome partitioning protein
MRTLAIANQKGGVGKTTTAVNLAACCAERGQRVLLVDLDAQASASDWLGVKEEGKGILEVFTDGAPLAPLVRETEVPGLAVVPASLWLASAERALAGQPGAEVLLRKAFRKLPNRWDMVVVDCPPTLGFLAVAALTACKEVFVPVEAKVMALKGLAQLTKTVDMVRDRLNEDLELSAILACRVNRTRLAGEVVESLRKHFGKKVLHTVIRENVRLAEAPSFVKPINLYAPESSGAEDYRAAARELLR